MNYLKNYIEYKKWIILKNYIEYKKWIILKNYIEYKIIFEIDDYELFYFQDHI